MESVKRRDLFSAPLDEGRPAGEEERHVRAEPGRDGLAPVAVELRIPGFQCGVDRGRRVR